MSVFALITVKTPGQLDTLAMHTYILGIIVGVVFLALAAIVATSIKFEGGQYAKDPARRRFWFWILLFGCFAAYFLYNMFVVAPTVNNSFQSKFMGINLKGSCIAAGTYLVVGFVLSKMFSKGKLGNWFPSKK